MTLALLLPLLQIGGGLASKLLEEDNPKLARNIQTLIGSFTAGAEGMSSLAGAFASPSTGMKIAGGKLGDLGESTGMINPKGFGAFEGALPEGISGAFGGKNTLPESLGGAFKSPGWNAPESIFNPPGEMKPFDWSLF